MKRPWRVWNRLCVPWSDVALEESLKLFQEGTELVRNCQKLLDEAQLQIKKIMTAPDGSPVEEVFQDEP